MKARVVLRIRGEFTPIRPAEGESGGIGSLILSVFLNLHGIGGISPPI